MQCGWSSSVVATLSLAFIAVLAIVVPMIQNWCQAEKERKKLALDHIIQWAEKALAIISKYPSVYFEELEDLLVQANVLKAERFAVIIKAESFSQNFKTLVNDAAERLDDFVQQADRHIGMGRKQRIKVPTELESIFECLIKTTAKLRQSL